MPLRPIDNPPHRWNTLQHEFLEAPPPASLKIFEERAVSILSENDSPDIGLRWSLNAYRGCLHGCAYCYARPSHQYLDFGAGTDFETKLVVKVNAPDLLEEAFRKRSWRGERIMFSGNTDAYQALEATYGLTRKCLEICLRYRNPIGIITKSSLVARDAGLLAALERDAGAVVVFSIPFSDDRMARAIEPWAPSPTARFTAMKTLAATGVPVGVGIAPMIPGLCDSQVPEILKRAATAGAKSAFCAPLRLPGEVAAIFEDRLRAQFPDRADRVLNAIREMRGGELNDPRFGHRMTGNGPRFGATLRLFEVWSKRLGLNIDGPSTPRETFRRPGDLF